MSNGAFSLVIVTFTFYRCSYSRSKPFVQCFKHFFPLILSCENWKISNVSRQLFLHVIFSLLGIDYWNAFFSFFFFIFNSVHLILLYNNRSLIHVKTLDPLLLFCFVVVMDNFGDNFDDGDIDPAAEFLAREQSQLAGLEDDLNTPNVPIGITQTLSNGNIC